jgi:NTE family protein
MVGLCNNMTLNPSPNRHIVYFLQGGGALGAYQLGVCKQLMESGYHPNWVIGTSIGAINAAILAGNPPQKRIAKMNEFWDSIASPPSPFDHVESHGTFRQAENLWTSLLCLLSGQPHFFSPRPINPWLLNDASVDQLSFYDTTPLNQNLERLIDFDLINDKTWKKNNPDKWVRLTLSAVRLDDGTSAFFDNITEEIRPEHIMASGALPPGFPAIKIKDTYYWDGGLSYITPLSVLFDSKVDGDLLCFMVDLFANRKETPENMFEILIRKKDLQFANHYRHMLHYFCEIYHFRHALLELCAKDPSLKDHPIYEKLQSSELFTLNIVRFHYRDGPEDLLTKDFEFSPKTLRERYHSGVADVERALLSPHWQKPFPPYLGVALHEF